MKSCFLIIPSILLLVACGSPKKATETTTHKTVSSKDFPYIEAFHNAVRLNMREDLEGAKKSYEYCLSIRQNDDAVYFGLSQIAAKQNNLLQAIQYSQKAHSIDPKNIWYTEQTAELLYSTQQFEKAVPYFKKLVEYEQHNLKWLYGYGDCLMRLGKIDETIKVLDQAEAILGKSPELTGEKYNLLMRVKKDELAIREVEKAIVDFPEEISLIALLVDYYFKKGDEKTGFKYLEMLQNADPENGRANIALGDYSMRKGDYDKAFEYFIKGFPSQDVDIDAKMNLIILLQESKYVTDPRLDTLINVLKLNHPNEAKSYTIAADQAMYDQDVKSATAYYRKALEFEKKIYPIWQQAIMLTYEENDMEKLYALTKECIEYFPSNPTVYYFKTIASIELNKPDEAIDAIDAALIFLGTKDTEYIAELEAQRGVAYFLKKDFNEGYKFLKAAMTKDPNSNVIKSIFALQMTKGKVHLDEAKKVINKAIELSSDHPHYHYVRGMVNFAQKDYKNALIDFENSITFEPEDRWIGEYNERLGDAYFLTGDANKALQFWTKAKELGKSSDTLNKKISNKIFYEEPL